VRLAANTATP